MTGESNFKIKEQPVEKETTPNNVLNFKSKFTKADNTSVDFTAVGELTIGGISYVIGTDSEGFWRLGKVEIELNPEGDCINVEELSTEGINIHSDHVPPTVFLSAVMSIIEVDMFGDEYEPGDFEEDDDDDDEDEEEDKA
jgi:hypothetical protein